MARPTKMQRALFATLLSAVITAGLPAAPALSSDRDLPRGNEAGQALRERTRAYQARDRLDIDARRSRADGRVTTPERTRQAISESEYRALLRDSRKR
ncbi:MAG: hypothetical protein NW205_00735 [Hyphomicrobiaceae bacterium]|nr:hypothetical protein [Hyphomicrobiaceae bacterium]